MKVSVKLLTSKPANEFGYALILLVSEKQQRCQAEIGRAFTGQFSDAAQMVLDSHPDYDILAPKIMELKIKARRLLLNWDKSAAALLAELLRENTSNKTVSDYHALWVADQAEMAAAAEKKGDIKRRNQILGYAASIANALAQFEACVGKPALSDFDGALLERFKKTQKMAGNADATVHLYLRSVRKLYNEAVRYYRMPNTKPFEGVFRHLTIKSSEAKKKYVDRATVTLLEGLNLGVEQGRARDLFLLQFYLGGCDLTDLYFLRRLQLRKGYVRFERGKTNVFVELPVHPKAQAIIERWQGADAEYVFPWKKDKKYYENFRRRNGKALIELQEAQGKKAAAENNEALRIDVLPGGGNLAVKVARHTFANLAKGLMLDPDLIRELMGHERNDTDNWYKDKFPKAVRDAALFQVIG